MKKTLVAVALAALLAAGARAPRKPRSRSASRAGPASRR